MLKPTKVINEDSLNPNAPPRTVTSTGLSISTDKVTAKSSVPMYIAIGVAVVIIVALLAIIFSAHKKKKLGSASSLQPVAKS